MLFSGSEFCLNELNELHSAGNNLRSNSVMIPKEFAGVPEEDEDEGDHDGKKNDEGKLLGAGFHGLSCVMNLTLS